MYGVCWIRSVLSAADAVYGNSPICVPYVSPVRYIGYSPTLAYWAACMWDTELCRVSCFVFVCVCWCDSLACNCVGCVTLLHPPIKFCVLLVETMIFLVFYMIYYGSKCNTMRKHPSDFLCYLLKFQSLCCHSLMCIDLQIFMFGWFFYSKISSFLCLCLVISAFIVGFLCEFSNRLEKLKFHCLLYVAFVICLILII